jgi:hypothetical protein
MGIVMGKRVKMCIFDTEMCVFHENMRFFDKKWGRFQPNQQN